MPSLERWLLYESYLSSQKWPFSPISPSVHGVVCPTYCVYVSAQPLDFIDLAELGARLRGLRVGKWSKEKWLISDLETARLSKLFLRMDTT